MQSSAPLTVLGLVAVATTAILCGDTAGKLVTEAGVQPLFVAWSRFALAAAVLARPLGPSESVMSTCCASGWASTDRCVPATPFVECEAVAEAEIFTGRKIMPSSTPSEDLALPGENRGSRSQVKSRFEFIE